MNQRFIAYGPADAGHADPTMKFLRDLENPDLFEKVVGVPIFKPHRREIKNPLTGQVIREIVVTSQDLPRIAAAGQFLERNHGVIGRMTDGHLRPGEPEANQPALLGYFRNQREGTFGPTNEHCILADCYFDKSKKTIASQRPYRSVEYYPESMEITGLALLLRDPQLDLGTVMFSNTRRGDVAFYDGGIEPEKKKKNEGEGEGGGAPPKPPLANDPNGPLTLAMLQALPQWQYLCQMQQGGQQPMNGMPGPAGGAAGMAMGTGVPGAGNVMPPAPPQTQMASNAQFLAYEQQTRELVATVNQLRRERDIDRCKAVVYELQQQGYSFPNVQTATGLIDGVEAEAQYQASLAEPARAVRVKEIRERWQRTPVGQNNRVPVETGGYRELGGVGGVAPTSQEQYQRAVAMATDYGLDYDDALALVRAGKTKPE